MTTTPQQLAAWEVGALRRGSDEFTRVVESTRSWLLRAEAVLQAVSAPGAWDGPAGNAARTSLQTWLAVVARFHPALQALAEGVAAAVSWYARAQEAAESALRAAAATGVVIGAGGVVPPPGPTPSMDADQAAAAAERLALATAVQAQLDEAFRLAARADALVASDVGVFSALGVPGFRADSDYVDLMHAVNVTFASAGRLPTVPSGADPAVVATWWAALPLDVQLRLISERPELVGGLDGVRARARDAANRALLDRAVRELTVRAAGEASTAVLAPMNEQLSFVLAVQAALEQAAVEGRPAQLYLLDIDAGLAAISVGDLDSADSVAVIVPGAGTDVSADMGDQVQHAADLWAATKPLAGAEEVAVLAWIGYDTPLPVQALAGSFAAAGGPLLASAVGGITARPGGTPPRTTVVAHSYGTVTTSLAAARPGEFGASSVVLLGSPGTYGTAAGFDVPEERVYIGEAGDDWIADTWAHGVDPSWEWYYGGTCMPADMPLMEDSDHYHYFDPQSEAMHNMALIVAGRYAAVARCDD